MFISSTCLTLPAWRFIMKKAKIVLILSLLVLIGILLYFYISTREEKPEVVSQREQYQQELQQKEGDKK